MDEFAAWNGRTESHSDHITAAPMASLAATIDINDPGSALPPLWHWAYFTPKPRASEVGVDGHPKRGGFLPPVSLPRRMWAGGRLRFEYPLRVGDEVTRHSTITRIDSKRGRSGALVFVTVKHEITNALGLAISEEQDIVYRDNPDPSAVPPEPQMARIDEDFSREITPDSVLLFRYSALTFNGHRIHYDRSYATEVEGYPGLVVHGPLIATFLVDLLSREMPNAVLKQFDFKAAGPLFDIHTFTVCGKREADGVIALWARNHLGHLAMSARAVIN